MLVSGIDYEVGVTFPEAIKKKNSIQDGENMGDKEKGREGDQFHEQMETPLLRQKDQQKA